MLTPKLIIMVIMVEHAIWSNKNRLIINKTNIKTIKFADDWKIVVESVKVLQEIATKIN